VPVLESVSAGNSAHRVTRSSPKVFDLARVSELRGSSRDYSRAFKASATPDIAWRDVRHELVKLAKPTVTPEAAVFDARGHLVYKGRIDDRFIELGRNGPGATRHDSKTPSRHARRQGP